MKTWRSGLDYAFLGDEGVLVVMVGNQMLRMHEDIPEKVSNSAVNTLAGITPEQPSSPPQVSTTDLRHPSGVAPISGPAAGGGHGWITGTADVDAMNAADEAAPSSPPQDARVRSAEATKLAAGGDTPTPLTDALGERPWTEDAIDELWEHARRLERVARRMAEALKNADIFFGRDAERRQAIAAWRELEEQHGL